MSPGTSDDPAIYGPVNGVFVTLAEFQQWQQQTYAANQAQAQAQFNLAEQTFGVSVPNPYVTVATSTPPVLPTSTSTPNAALKAHYVVSDPDLYSYCTEYGDDPLCDLWGGGGIGIGGGTTTVIEQPIIIEQGIQATNVNAAIDAGLSSVWSGFVGTLDGVLAALIAALQSALTAVGNALKAAYAVLSRLAGFMLNMLQTLLRAVVAGIMGALNDIRDVLKGVYNDVLKPIAGVLGSLRQRLLDAYQRFIRPMLIWIQDVRRILSILALFHVPFAQKLDAKLADLERRITQPFLYLLSYTNAIANWINLISTSTYLLQQPIWLWSLNAYMGQTLNMQLNAMTVPIGAADLAAANNQNSQPSIPQSEAAGLMFLEAGAGPYATIAAQSTADLDAMLAQGPQ